MGAGLGRGGGGGEALLETRQGWATYLCGGEGGAEGRGWREGRVKGRRAKVGKGRWRGLSPPCRYYCC